MPLPSDFPSLMQVQIRLHATPPCLQHAVNCDELNNDKRQDNGQKKNNFSSSNKGVDHDSKLKFLLILGKVELFLLIDLEAHKTEKQRINWKKSPTILSAFFFLHLGILKKSQIPF